METPLAAPTQPAYAGASLTRPALVGTIAGMMLALLLASLDQTVVGTAMPRIIEQLSGFDRYPWVTTAYLLTSTIAVAIFGRLSDIYGRKIFLVTGTAFFVAASALCGAAGEIPLPLDGMNQLIVFRGLQGLGAGIIVGLVFTAIGDLFTLRERARYQGLFASMFGISSVFGPMLGGWITDHLSWRWAFYVNAPIGILACGLLWTCFPHLRNEHVKRVIDWIGVLTLVLCLGPLLLALSAVSALGWGSPRVLGMFAVAAVMLVLFLRNEKRAVEPILPLDLFRTRAISASSAASFLVGAGMFGAVLYIPLYLQGVLGLSAAASGSTMTPFLLTMIVTAIASGQLMSRLGRYKLFALIGAPLVALGMVLLTTIGLRTTRWEVILYLILLGLGLGVMQPVFNVIAQQSVPRSRLGVATASIQFFRSIGSTVGVAVFGTVLLSIYHGDFDRAVPPGTSAAALRAFENPLQVARFRPHLDAAVLDPLLALMKTSLLHGLHWIFFAGAIIMVLALIAAFFLPELRPEPSPLPRKEPSGN